jgi:hypothetical protein
MLYSRQDPLKYDKICTFVQRTIQLEDARNMFHIYIEAVYLYCLRHEWRESVGLKENIYAEEFLLHQQKACT